MALLALSEALLFEFSDESTERDDWDEEVDEVLRLLEPFLLFFVVVVAVVVGVVLNRLRKESII